MGRGRRAKVAAAALLILAALLLLLILCTQIRRSSHGRRAMHNCYLFHGSWVYDVNDEDEKIIRIMIINITNRTMYPPIVPSYRKSSIANATVVPTNSTSATDGSPPATLPGRFDGGDLLGRLRGKRIMFVGDSLSLNQWQSLTCMLHVAVPDAIYSSNRSGELSTFRFPEYNASIMFLRNPFLVDITREKIGRVLKLDSVNQSSAIWNGMDVLIFNSWHWWLHTGRKQPWDLVEQGDEIHKDMDRLVAYEKALNTWASWVETSVDPAKTRVIFQGVSPDHDKGSDWGQPGATCEGQWGPVTGPTYPGGPHPAQVVVERVLKRMKRRQVHLLDITALSQFRKDGHPSVYGLGGSKGLDCTHWCLPGLPDAWNHLLYSSILRPTLI
ncbi:hypothetical protein NMG60_11032746 [Bertholletia excelsa]